MARKEINWKVEEKDVKEITKPTNIEIPIDKGMYSYFLRDGVIHTLSTPKYLKTIESEMVNRLYKGKYYNLYKRLLEDKFTLSFVPDFKNNNWKLLYSPVEIVNNIFKILNINEKIDYIDYGKDEKVNEIKLFTFMVLTRELSAEKDRNKILFLKDTIDNLEKIFSLKDYDIESRIKDYISYKDLLYYLSVKSLDIVDYTDDDRYMIIPRQYYFEVSSKGSDGAEYPHQMHFGNRDYAANYTNFNDRFNETLMRYPNIFEEALDIDEISVMDRIEVITADNFIEDIEEDYNSYILYVKKKKKNYTKTDEEINKMLNKKISFYKELINKEDENQEKVVISPVKGKNDLQGYYGFVLNNNYIVLDKFFTKRKTDDKVKPAYDEAIYSMPLDLFVLLDGSKRRMMLYIKKNPKGNVKRNYHTKKCSFEQRILNIIDKEDVSAMNSDWFLTIYAPKKLKLDRDEE